MFGAVSKYRKSNLEPWPGTLIEIFVLFRVGLGFTELISMCLLRHSYLVADQKVHES